VHVGVHDGRHLRFLDRADLAMRVHDEDRHILLSAQAVDGCGSGITTCRANDGQMFPIAAGLALVLADEEVLEEVAQELQRDILEGECRPVEQLEQMQVLLLVECDGGHDVFGAECRVAAVDDVLEVCRRDLGRGDVEREDLESEVCEGEVLPLGRPVIGQRGDFLGDEEAAVGSETLEDNFLEGELCVVNI
jgi:hypothetical protein